MKHISIIITYNPSEKNLINLCRNIKSQNSDILIVNNSLLPLSFVEKLNTISCIDLGYNYGIAYAQNRGIEFALSKSSYEYISFFDQDSDISENYFNEALIYLKNHPDTVVVPIVISLETNLIIPSYKLHFFGLIQKKVKKKKHF